MAQVRSLLQHQRNSVFICRDGIAKNIVNRHATARTLSMQKVRAVGLHPNKHAIERKWGCRDNAVRSPTAPWELRWRAQVTQ